MATKQRMVPLLLMRTRGILGTLIGKHKMAKASSTKISKSTGTQYVVIPDGEVDPIKS